MRISRGCYNKFHRCPGWAGGGPRYARETRCDNGSLIDVYGGRWWRWRWQRCDTCDVTVLPYVTRWMSVPHLTGEARRKVRDLMHRWKTR